LIFHDNLVDFYQTGEKGDPIMPTYKFENKIPKIAKTSYVHPRAAIIGDVEIGDGCFIGAGAVLRGDFGKITIGRGTSIQENCVIHGGGKERVSIGSNVIIAHGAILHDVTIKSYVLVGMGSILMTGVFCGNHHCRTLADESTGVGLHQAFLRYYIPTNAPSLLTEGTKGLAPSK
jgi:UDP-3-O-[3-hydroxymyristoyl] glucosamine N-acyltransferase